MRYGSTLAAVACLASLLGTGAAARADDRDAARQERRTPVVEVFEHCRDAVVNISATEIVTVRGSGGTSLFEEFFDLPRSPRTRQYRRQSVGSGFVIHPQGYIVTNAHVVNRTTERKAIFADGREYEAQIIACDPERDLAVLKVDAGEPLPTIKLGRSDDLMIGETVIAVGNPLGYQNTVTAGVVSAVGRDLEFPNAVVLRDLIQTDASINPGNSGGPLLNVRGELIGVNSAIRGDAENIGFAIPADQLRQVLPELLDVHRRYGIRTGLTLDQHDPPRVQSVEPDSPAADAGLVPGDVVTAIDGLPVTNRVDFHISLIGTHPGRHMRMTTLHAGTKVTRELVVSARPAPDGATLARDRLGLEVVPLPENVSNRLQLPGGAGLLVVEVAPDSPAAESGVERRDVLITLGRYYIASLDDLGQLLEAAHSGEELPISVLRVDRFGKYRLNGSVRVR